MTSLASNLRSKLEKVVVDARDIAELGAKEAIEALAVHYHEPYGHMSPEDRALRSRLRAHARQLGDRKDPKTGGQKIDHLVTECAYEHWHRMLFARFLAENHLLIEPESGVAISLEECEEIAKEEGVDPWALASRYAQQMLPQIFRQDNPVLLVTLPRNYRVSLEMLLASLDPAVFTASDSLGWVYQFWQSKKKDEVNKSEKKIGADELPAVTQLFTEPYMVSFLLDNSLGAWWASRRLMENDLKFANSEEELRRKAAIPGLPLEYLRFVQSDDGSWTPATGNFEHWPENLGELKTLDPCCGSGHFLVAMLLMLVPMRMESEGLPAQEAVDAVIRENIHGLELDQRCVELAAFALAFTAWKYPEAGGYRVLPELNVACTGLSNSARKEEWIALAGDNINLKLALEELYTQFKDAPALGSLIDPVNSLGKGSLFELNWDEVWPFLAKALKDENDDEKTEMGVVAKGMCRAASILSDKYNLVATNVPYRSSIDLSPDLNTFFKKYYNEASTAIETVFLVRCLKFCCDGSSTCLVLPQDWLFKTSYKSMRKRLLVENTWKFIALLGPKAFQTPMWDFNVQLLVMNRGVVSAASQNIIRGVDVSKIRNSEEKSNQIKSEAIQEVDQAEQISNPDSRIVLKNLSRGARLGSYAKSVQGIKTGDDGRVRRNYWEVSTIGSNWVLYQSTFPSTRFYGGLEYVIFWADKGEGLARRQGNRAWNFKGLAVSQMSSLPSAIYLGSKYDSNMTAIVPLKEENFESLLAYGVSGEMASEVRKIDSSLKPTNGSFEKIPFDLHKWTKFAEERFPKGLPKPFSDDPTQWIFHGHPCGSVVWNEAVHWTTNGSVRCDATVPQVAVARLLGYRWPAELDHDMELADEQRKWVKRCEVLLPYADEDGIVCLPAIRREDAAADRLAHLLSAAYGSEWSPTKERELLVATGSKAKDLDNWLRNDFFEQHCKLFGHRPFIWHIWDGRKRDGFHALVNYHKLAEGSGMGRKLLEKLTYGYLGDWIKAQRDGVTQGSGGAEDRLAAALELERRLKAILEGEPPYDIFVRWKPIEEQPIGWEPDINDGVRINIRPFMAEDIPGGRTGAGILRWAPNIKWDKDRGKDVVSAPWYPVFNGERINNHHLTNTEKWAAREAANQEKRGKG